MNFSNVEDWCYLLGSSNSTPWQVEVQLLPNEVVREVSLGSSWTRYGAVELRPRTNKLQMNFSICWGAVGLRPRTNKIHMNF